MKREVGMKGDAQKLRIIPLFFSLLAGVACLAVTMLPVTVSADQLQQRSVELSSASVSAEGVTYRVGFTARNDAGAFVIDFCRNTPLIGQACEAPNGLSVSNVASNTAGFTASSAGSSGTTIIVTGAISEGAEIKVALAGITNPSVEGQLYARIITYEMAAQAQAYTAEDIGSGVVDSGSVAVAITPTIGVMGQVAETVTFCVSATEIGAQCANATPPNVRLGEKISANSDEVALVPNVINESALYTQVTTNALYGVVVRLKSSATDCGGLIRAESGTCDIKPAVTTGLSAKANTALFGVKVASLADTGEANGAFQAAAGSPYRDDQFKINYQAYNQGGVTGPFGDPFLDTNGAPASGKNLKLTFGATIGTDTPAGTYSTSLTMIAVGKF